MSCVFKNLHGFFSPADCFSSAHKVELCVQRRTALDLIGEGVPDWEDENIEQAAGPAGYGEKRIAEVRG